MGIRTILRIGMVALATVVGFMVRARWEPEPAASSGAEARPVPEMPTAEPEREVRSSTRSLDVTQHADGRKVLRVFAERQTDFEDGWNIWDQPVIVIYGRERESGPADVRITGETMRTAGEVGDFSEVRIIGQVSAELPGGGAFETRRIDYDAVTGIASNCNRNALVYSGLRVGSDCLELDTSGSASGGEELVPEQLRMWGALVLSADPESGSRLPEGLSGEGEELRFRPGGDRVTIVGSSSLDFRDVSIQADRLELTVGSDLRELEAVAASGSPSLRFGDGGGTRRLAGAEIEIELAEAALEVVRARGRPARLNLPDVGALRAREIQLAVAGESTEVTASGAIEWSGDERSETGLRTLTSEDLVMRSERGRLSELEAGGGVRLEGGEALDGVFVGPTLTMAWTDGELTRADWSEGVEIDAGGRRVTAGAAGREEDSWILDGDPRPYLSAEGVEVGADRLTIADDGELEASGEVAGRLGGERVSAGAALFGDAAEVEIEAGELILGTEGQTRMQDDVRLVWGSQSLGTDELVLERAPGRLRAIDNVELVVALEEGEAGEANPVTLLADDMLIEEDSGDIRVAGDARLRDGQRTISADRMAILLDDAGGWRRIEAEGEVEFSEPDVTAEGDKLEYDLQTEELLLLAGEDEPARFVYQELEYQSTEALRVLRRGDELVIEATEAGRTTTKVVPTGGETGGQK